MTFAALVCIAVQLPFLDHLGITLTSLQGFRTSVPARLLALTFVVEGMGQNVMEDESRSAEGFVSIGEMKFRIAVELFIRQV